jgi:hypothetical protein
LGGAALGFGLVILNLVISLAFALPFAGYDPPKTVAARAAPYVAVGLWICETVLVVVLLVWVIRGERPRRWPRPRRLVVLGAAFVMLGGMALCDGMTVVPSIFQR